MKITTPGRICLFGEHQDYLGLPVIALAISLRSSITVAKRRDKKIIINMPNLNRVEDFSLDDLEYTKDRDYFKSAIRLCLNNGLRFSNGFEAKIESDIPIQAGISSSSSIVVGWINLISKMADNPPNWNNERIGKLAYQAEVVAFNEPGGMMDQFSTAIGGCIHIEQEPFTVTQLNPNLKTFVLGDSNQPKDTLDILRRCRDQRKSIIKKINNVYPEITFENCTDAHGKSILNHDEQGLFEATIENREIQIEALNELKKDTIDHNRIGDLFIKHHAVLRDKLKVSTSKIDKMLQASIEAGALGGKISGSGGGGCMFAYAPEKPLDVAQAIKNAGGTAVIIHADDGTRID